MYAPRDLRANQLARFQQGGRDSGTGIPQVDLVDVLGVNPLDLYSVRFYRDPTVVSRFSFPCVSTPSLTLISSAADHVTGA